MQRIPFVARQTLSFHVPIALTLDRKRGIAFVVLSVCRDVIMKLSVVKQKQSWIVRVQSMAGIGQIYGMWMVGLVVRSTPVDVGISDPSRQVKSRSVTVVRLC
jgi:hypothetical protein